MEALNVRPRLLSCLADSGRVAALGTLCLLHIEWLRHQNGGWGLARPAVGCWHEWCLRMTDPIRGQLSLRAYEEIGSLS